MSTTFPRVRRPRLGYNVDQVEDFLEEARRAYTAERGEPSVVSAESIRRVAFDLEKGGYSTTHVDSALERLEDAFAGRERDQVSAEVGDATWFERARDTAQEILDRLDRPAAHRFDRVGPLSTGYHPTDVDAFGDQLTGYFQDGTPMSVDEVRGAAFRSRRGGYSEAQVDLLLDAVIDVMLAVR
ncbi:DivIVA domain-containing protein [Glaciihabitans tibetensis]|uniref:DivIVA domain-containing protein n=1 Tax=Glaciihabitans tibetensis TaxID=1266600 RepID=A0A2T0VIF5_9MICO|nr:DivIVA domain-containing protein [Glaciihabitans tibetensis]PRY69963.1 DivIVA domain-containing protein [Glaciihabitans tibetensis]